MHLQESATALVSGDVILSKTAYAAASLVNVTRCNVSQDTIAVQIASDWKKRLLSGYLVAFLNTQHGQALMERQFQGNVQAHLSLPDGRKLPVPLFGDQLQKVVHDSILKADGILRESKVIVTRAEQALLHALALDDWQPTEPLTYTGTASQVLSSARADAEYFAPRVAELMNLHTSASLYPAISERDLLKLPIPRIPADASSEIVTHIRAAHAARKEAQALLELAKRAVEVAIEEGEEKALAFISHQ